MSLTTSAHNSNTASSSDDAGRVPRPLQFYREALKQEAKVTKVEKPLESYRNPHVRSAQEMQRSKEEQVPITARLKVRDLQVILKDLRRLDLLYFKS